MTHPTDTIDAGPSVTNAGGHNIQPNASQDTVRSKVSIDEVRDFFRSSPPVLVKHVDHITSDGTRKPADFDKHLASDLLLRRVVYLPSMMDDLAKIAEDALESAHLAGALPNITDHFPTSGQRSTAFKASGSERIICEKQIENIYQLTTAKHCCCVASTLEFGLPAWRPGNLKFSLQGGTNHSQAKADGFLMLDGAVSSDEDIVIPPLTESDQALANDFSTLSIWEFKSLVAGDPPVMEAIFDQTCKQTFKWEGCELGQGCSARHKTNTGLPRQTRSPMGFDAKDPLCKLPEKFPRRFTAKPETVKTRTKAKHITQQTWAEAVINDTTFVVINAGNYEIIGIRHRKQQTLYLSKLIDVTSPGYYQINTGLYLAIIRDARDRSLQLKGTVPETWTRVFSTPVTAGLRPADVMGEVDNRDWLVVNPANKGLELLPFRPNSHYLRKPSIRHIVNPTSLDLALLFRVNVSCHVTQSVAFGAVEVDGVVFKRSLSDRRTETVVMKCAGNYDSIQTLRNEYQVYLHLQERGVTDIPKIIGYYEHANVEKRAVSFPCSILIMEHIGLPVNLEPAGRFSIKLRQQFLSALKKIHTAGYKHGNITKDHLLVRDQHLGGGIGFVSLGTAAPAGDVERAMEYLALSNLLPETLKRELEEGEVAQYSDFLVIPGVEPHRKIRRLGTW